MKALRWVLLVFCVVWSLGCGGSVTAPVEGEVKLRDGTPLPSGIIRLIPIEIPDAKPVFTRIDQGKYQLVSVPGKHRIELTAFRKSAKGEVQKEAGKTVTVFPEEQYLPARYNLESQEVIEIVGGTNKKDFVIDLK